MVQQRRFLDAVANRRLLSTIGGIGDPGPSFARIARMNSGDWQVTAIKVPRTRVTDHTELTLAVGPGGDLEEGFRLQFGNREFDSLALGNALYLEVAQHLKRLRRTGASYPVHLTGVISAEGDNGRPCRLIELLRMKQQVEQRLAEEMR